jgi:hypothetical protein
MNGGDYEAIEGLRLVHLSGRPDSAQPPVTQFPCLQPSRARGKASNEIRQLRLKRIDDAFWVRKRV